uniref:NB-ARC domain-containing protein n=1 Tax=Oryza meridionalis TaxID=40149 RepID=A0A0E0CIR7_9ORYZ
MEAAVGAASWLLSKVLTQLSRDMVTAYVASTELGLNVEEIKRDLKYTQGLLHMAQGRKDIRDNIGLQGLLQDLSKKADEAEDALDEIHYFIIQDQIDGTHEVIPEADGGLRGHALHGRHALRHTAGNWFSCFFCSSARARHDGDDSQDIANSHGDVVDQVVNLPFNRVDMSNKIKSVVKGIHDLCTCISRLLQINQTAGEWDTSLERPPTSSMITQDKLFGREIIFRQTLHDLTNCTIPSGTLSVLPIVGPGGIGKTTFAQHLYNDKRTDAYFPINVWLCVSTNFDVLRLTQEILKCIPHDKSEGSEAVHNSSNLDQLQKAIAERLKSQMFLLVLDDMWKCGSEGLEDSEFFTFFEECIFGQDKPECYKHDLIGIAKEISKKLRGSPLAAKTVGRLLKNNLSHECWTEVLEMDEWKNLQSNDDIMPALKISYDYLPYYLKKCFSYCALYPEDHRFNNLEITCFWEAIGIIDSGYQNDRAEAIGLKYLNELIGNGFLMKFLDLGHGNYILPDDINRLANLHYFLAKKELCSNIRGIGKMKYLRRLQEFHVKKERTGFELRELGYLKELGGALQINNLENIATTEEANGAELMLKRNLKTLELVWGAEQQNSGSEIIEGLQPPSNLRALGIRNHGGSTGPSWLCDDICVKGLRSLHLEGISWATLPPFGQFIYLEELTLINIAGIRQFGPDFGGVTQRSFLHLKKVRFVAMPELVDWVGGAHCHLFSKLASIECEECPKLSMLLPPSSERCISHTQDINITCFPNLCSLNIRNCPKLSLPPMPHTSTLTHIIVKGDYQEVLHLEEKILSVNGYGGSLAFHNLQKVENMKIEKMSHISWTDLQKLKSLSSLTIIGCKSLLCSEVDEGVIFHSVEQLNLYKCHLAGISLAKLLKCFPALTKFELNRSGEAQEVEEAELRFPSPRLLRYVKISGYENLVLPMEVGGSFQDFSSLQELEFWRCGKIFASWFMVEAGTHQTSKPFLAPLKELTIYSESSVQSMAVLSSLTSLTRLRLVDCDNLTVVGFDPVMTGSLNELVIYNKPDIDDNNHRFSVAAHLFAAVATTKAIPVGSFQQLKQLEVDSISAVFVAPICSLLASTLYRLKFTYDLWMKNFTKEQEQALQLLTSLRNLEFYECHRLQSLPEGLHLLSSICTLGIVGCPEIRSLPEEGIPASLKKLLAMRCSVDLKDQLKRLEESNQDLQVFYI